MSPRLTKAAPVLYCTDLNRTSVFFTESLGFIEQSRYEAEGYLILTRDEVELHYQRRDDLDPVSNDGNCYVYVGDIETLYHAFNSRPGVIHPNGRLVEQPWHTREFVLLDPDYNALRFGESMRG
ncbi:MAG: bleomycin resistance protein [Phototrophicaceae bacterium]